MRRVRLFVLAALVGVLAATQLAVPAHAAPPSGDGWFRLYSTVTLPQRCVVDRATQVYVYTYTCGTWDDQYFTWVLRHEVSGVRYYNIVNYATGDCIGADNPDNNRPIRGSNAYCDLWGFQWTMVWNSAGSFYQLRNRNGKCMVARTTTDLVVQFSCGDWADQAFTWVYW